MAQLCNHLAEILVCQRPAKYLHISTSLCEAAASCTGTQYARNMQAASVTV